MAAAKKSKPRKAPKAKGAEASRPARVGRPSKLTTATVRAITDAIAAGDTIEDSCIAAGITSATLRGWRAKARTGTDAKLRNFLADLEHAQSLARRNRLRQIADGRMINGEKDWKATAAYLKLTDPMFSNAAITERALDNEMGARLEAMEAHMTGDGIAEMWEAYAKVRGITIE